MSTTEDVARLKLETIGDEGLDDLRKKLAAIPAELGQVTAAFGRGELTIDEYDKEVKSLTASHRQLSAALAELEKGAGKAKGGMAGLGQAGLQTGRVIQDFTQGGIAGILNNIEGLSMALGGGPGLAGVLTALGIVIFTFKGQLSGLLEMFLPEKVKPFTDAVTTLKDRIKELEDKPIKLAVDTHELENAKRQLADLEKAAQAYQTAISGRTRFERAAGARFNSDWEETGEGGKAATEAVRQQILREKNASSPTLAGIEPARRAVAEAQGELARAIDAGSRRLAQQSLDDAKKELERLETDAPAVRAANAKAAEDEVGTMFAGVQAGNNPAARAGFAKRLRQVGKGEYADMVAGATPKAAQASEELDAELERIDSDLAESIITIKARFARANAREKKRLEAANKAGEAAEADPESKQMQLELEAAGFTSGHFDPLKAQRAARAKLDKQRKAAGAEKLEKQADPDAARRNVREFNEQQLAKRIFAQSQGLTGVQFTPDQAAAAAKSVSELTGKNVGFNQALQSALAEQVQAMVEMANRLQQQQAQMRQLGQAFGQINRFMGGMGQTNLNFGMQ